MKHITIFLTIFLAISLVTSSQSNPLFFTEVVYVDGQISKEDLFNRANEWLDYTFRSNKEVIRIHNIVSGELSAKGYIFTHYLYDNLGNTQPDHPCYVKCKISIRVKDGRYKYEFSDYTDECNKGTGVGLLTEADNYPGNPANRKETNNIWKETKHGAIVQTKKLVKSLKNSMNRTIISDDNW